MKKILLAFLSAIFVMSAFAEDTKMTAAIKEELKEQNAAYSNILVKNEPTGLVTLDGKVVSHYEIPAIIERVLKVPGVEEVKSNLVVPSISGNERFAATPLSVPDEEIIGLVQERLLQEFDGIEISIKDAEVKLTGSVADYRDIPRIVDAVLEIDAVRKVYSELTTSATSDSVKG